MASSDGDESVIGQASAQPSREIGVEPDRKLVGVERILNIIPIVGADNIELAEIMGWQCIVKKGEYKVGDLVIYFGIDSILDSNDKNVSFLKEMRIKTIKMRGVYSQGLIGPMSWLSDRGFDPAKYKEGDDITKEMGVTKYVREEELSQYTKTVNDNSGPFPDCVVKTDEPRIQNDVSMLERIQNRDIVITRKEDGCSCTIGLIDGKFMVCSRNYECRIPDKSNEHYFHIVQQYDIEAKMRGENYGNIAIQGEIIGPRINGNKLKQEKFSFRVFNVWNIANRTYYNHEQVTELCGKLGLDTVPVLYCGPSKQFTACELTAKGLMAFAESLEYTKGDPAEGIVVKTNDQLGTRISFKVISNKFLLQNEPKKK
ncbi:MAG: hypothetical protein EBQ92_13795, partial [Proteobacteria bacterium]|nr:hypothetical protein [Pseudomonadota bacterium]